MADPTGGAEAPAQTVLHQHAYATSARSVDVKLTRNTAGYTFEVKVDRPLQPGETFEAAWAEAKAIVQRAERELGALYPAPPPRAPKEGAGGGA